MGEQIDLAPATSAESVAALEAAETKFQPRLAKLLVSIKECDAPSKEAAQQAARRNASHSYSLWAHA